MNNDTLLNVAFASLCGLGLLGGVALLFIGTLMKARFGINLGKARCGECREPAPTVRVPKTTYEILWGGWACEECGCENDKWGNPR